ncbi:permease [Pseudomonas sp.]|uniref:permease n=1 Tax=Pseudomonas sp. TaxID=306 RepID=UPI0032665438
MSVSKITRAYLSNASAFIPVIVFLMWGRFGPGEPGVRWDTAYVVSGILSIGHIFWLLKRRPGHWIALGVDLYLLIGALLAALSGAALQVWGQELGAAPVLACVLVIGVGATWFSPLGFIGEASNDQALVRRLSVWLLIAAAIAVTVSLILRHNILLGGVLPVIALVLARSQLQKRVAVAQ